MNEFRINELAQVSGVSVRNIRVYQDRGLLPPPTIRGRTGCYSDEHLVPLNLISRMLERGYTFATISELLHAAHYGMKVEHVLRAPAKGGRIRSIKRAATITFTELKKSLGASEARRALPEDRQGCGRSCDRGRRRDRPAHSPCRGWLRCDR